MKWHIYIYYGITKESILLKLMSKEYIMEMLSNLNEIHVYYWDQLSTKLLKMIKIDLFILHDNKLNYYYCF